MLLVPTAYVLFGWCHLSSRQDAHVVQLMGTRQVALVKTQGAKQVATLHQNASFSDTQQTYSGLLLFASGLGCSAVVMLTAPSLTAVLVRIMSALLVGLLLTGQRLLAVPAR